MEVVCLFLNRVWNLGFVLKTHTDCVCQSRQHFLCKRVFRNCSLFQVGSSLQVRRQTGEGAFLTKLLQTDTHADKK